MKSWIAAAIILFGIPARALPCSGPLRIDPRAIVREAEMIVRATAAEYVTPPADPRVHTTGVPDSVVRFKVVDVLKGQDVPDQLTLNGYLSDKDDFNDVPMPYNFVRPNGRSGSCFANTYRQGADFLLLLKRSGRSFTVNWSALAPVNEQLKSADDPWLTWVRGEVKREEALEGGDREFVTRTWTTSEAWARRPERADSHCEAFAVESASARTPGRSLSSSTSRSRWQAALRGTR